jgi:putative glutamine amidotransferase
VDRTAERPVIAVTGPTRGAIGPRSCVHLGLLLAGGRPLHLSPARPDAQERIHGVVVTGGHDIEPVLYSEPADVEANYDRERDALESRVIDEALKEGLPLLGICRGAQLLNVRLGGSLFRELRTRRRHTSNRRTIAPLKTLILEPHSGLAATLGAERVRINSLHNQAIDRVGTGLKVVGRDLDHIVQAIEHETRRYVVGVQWHPEFLLYSRRQRALFRGLVTAARERLVGTG